MNTEKKLLLLFEKWAGETAKTLSKLPQSGSDREYYRISGSTKTAIGVYNSDSKENRAFLSFTKHFSNYKLNVPIILQEDIANNIYLENDLGDETLFGFLSNERKATEFPDSAKIPYKKILKELPKFQITASEGLNYSVCYPRVKFDKQSMMWDLNYFKYYFLKLAKIPFDEQLIENDFEKFTAFLLETETDYFMYRDFQSRNIMIVNETPYFIDYQGGRKGALQYDLASLLFDAKANIPFSVKRELLNYYLETLHKFIDYDEVDFLKYFWGYVLIRILQAMGAYGFRGFYEKKEHFLQSIPPALENLEWLLNNIKFDVDLPELFSVLKQLVKSDELKKFGHQSATEKLTVQITSFSYKHGIPEDYSGNGGGFVFDCRAIHNPGRYDEYKALTGKDDKVKEFLLSKSNISKFLKNVFALVENSVKVYAKRKFTHLSVNFGCTGGQHRSVFCAEALAEYLQKNENIEIELHHREQEKLQK